MSNFELMNNIEELIEQEELEFDRYTNKTTIHKIELVRLMKEYAEFYAEQFRKNLLDEGYYDDFGKHQIDTKTIETLKLPEHE